MDKEKEKTVKYYIAVNDRISNRFIGFLHDENILELKNKVKKYGVPYGKIFCSGVNGYLKMKR